MALRLSKALGRSPESWLAMQDNYDLWQARKSANLAKVRKIRFEAIAEICQSRLSQPDPSPQCRNSANHAPATNTIDGPPCEGRFLLLGCFRSGRKTANR